MPREHFLDGKVDLTARETWDFVAMKYVKLFELLPGLDGVVLTLTETKFTIEDVNEVVISKPQARILGRMMDMISRICS